LGKGYGLQICDPQVEIARLVGGNRSYVEQHLPHLSRLLVSSLDDLCHCDMMVVAHPLHDELLLDRWLGEGKRILDLVGNPTRAGHPRYEGLYW
jgi:GDP-mannose 6-dehydrogenase